MLSISPLLAWFFTLVLILLAARATARLSVSPRLTGYDRNRELGHAAMGLGMAVLLVPGVPRPPLTVSVTFFAALAAWAAFDWAHRVVARLRGREIPSCAGSRNAHLLDPHHAIVSIAMVAMLLRPGMAVDTGPSMPGMAMGPSPGAATVILIAYVWLTALILGIGMTRILAAETTAGSGEARTLLSSPATVYACELAMTVLTGLMLVT
ncbi:MAG TPA: DUF5134 domain-containing protein [Actinospica sp.]|nr:DUF5134 domain-containing protein [Actinospica sp.]